MTSGTSRPTTWTCALSGTGSRSGPRSHPDLHARLLPDLAPAPGLAPLTFTDEHRPARVNPVAPARRSPSAAANAASKTGPGKQPIRGFRDLIDHLATLTRDTIRVGGQSVDKLAAPTPSQRRAFDLIGAPIPFTLT